MTISTVRPDAVSIESAPRPTAVPARVSFQNVLAQGARGLARGAEAALTSLPGGPLMASAVRGTLASTGQPAVGTLAGGMSAPEGPGASGVQSELGTGTGSGIESTLAHTQEMNLYYLRLQEETNAQNRHFTTLSNIMKTEHDTVKNAIGNIR